MCFHVLTGYVNMFSGKCVFKYSAHFKIKLFVVVALYCWALVWIPEYDHLVWTIKYDLQIFSDKQKPVLVVSTHRWITQSL